MNERGKKDLRYHFHSAVSQNSVSLYRGGKVRGKMRGTDQVCKLSQYLGLFKDEVFFQVPLDMELSCLLSSHQMSPKLS